MEVRHCVRCPSLASDALRGLQASDWSGASSGRLQPPLFRSLTFSSCSSVGVNARSLTSSHFLTAMEDFRCMLSMHLRTLHGRETRPNERFQDLPARCNSDGARCTSQEALEATSPTPSSTLNTPTPSPGLNVAG